MSGLPDFRTSARIARLREMQGLPPEIPLGHTIYRQSDFEKSKLWRAVFIAAFVIGIVNLVEPAPRSDPAPATAHDTRAVARPTV
ncbi:hypothetical protein BGLT_06784 [Caballeronia glathei]|nr:hypothetical protein [Caballeronia glathei]CDY77978.1 hypothetical protein BGLT_06784 [Caballeronia glathei]